MKFDIKSEIQKKRFKKGIKYIDEFPQLIEEVLIVKYYDIIIEACIEKYPGLIIESCIEKHPGLIIESCIEKHPGLIIESCIEKHSDLIIESCVEKHPDLIIESCVEKYPSLIIEACIEKYSYLIEEKYIVQYSDKIKKRFLEIIDIFTSDIELFNIIIKKIVSINTNFFNELIKNEPEIAKNIYIEIGSLNEIILGNIGSVEYNQYNSQLMLSGYFMPLEVLDLIEVYCDGKYLGNAELYIKRPDVYEKLPNYNSLYTGWTYSTQLEIGKIPKDVEVIVKKQDLIIKKVQKEVTIVSKKVDIEMKPFKIELNGIKIYNEECYKRVKRFNEISLQLNKWLDIKDIKYINRFNQLMDDIIDGTQKVEELFLKIYCDEEKKIINLKNVQLEYQDISRLWTIVNELLINEEYYFETIDDNPLIIDGGANIGLAIYYFKSYYPDSKIIAFEPSKEAYHIINKNIKINKWKDVELFPYALDDVEKEQTLYVPIEDCLGASLTRRPFEYNETEKVRKEVIQTKCLDVYIDKKVNFLKLDVEGVETRIIRQLGNKLKYVQHLFLEYHYGKMVEDNNLVELLELLDKQSIDYQIAKSPGFSASTSHQTMKYVGEKYSLNIWGKNKYLIDNE